MDTRIVKSSSGETQKRFVIKTRIKLGSNAFEIELTLAERDGMEYRMLLGREALMDRYLVDASQSFILHQYRDEEIFEQYRHLTKQSSGLKLGLLATKKNLYSNKKLMEAAEARGHEIHFLNIQHCYMKLDAQTPEVRYRGGKILDDLDSIIPRIRPSMTFYGCALLRQFDSIGT